MSNLASKLYLKVSKSNLNNLNTEKIQLYLQYIKNR